MRIPIIYRGNAIAISATAILLPISLGTRVALADAMAPSTSQGGNSPTLGQPVNSGPADNSTGLRPPPLRAAEPNSAFALQTSSNAGSLTNSATDAVPVPLTVDEAVRIGLVRNPNITGAMAGVTSASANFHSLSVFPNINLSVTNINGNSPAPTLNGGVHDTFVDFGELLDTSGQRRFQAKGARAQFRAASAQLAETRLGLVQQIRDAYWGLVAARAQTAIGNEGLADAQRVNDATHLQQAAGAAPRVDALRSDIDLANAKQASLTAAGAEPIAVAALNSLLARPPAAPLQPADSMAETDRAPTPVPGLRPVADLTDRALKERPAVFAASELVQAAEYATKGARAASLPVISVDYEASVKYAVQTTIVGLHMPLFDFGSIRQTVRAAQASANQARAQQRQAEQQVAQQVAQAALDYAQATQLATSYHADILTPSVTLLHMAQLGYQQGATGILPVIDAESTLRSARTGYIGSLLALYKAQDELLAATADDTVAGTSPLPAAAKSPDAR